MPTICIPVNICCIYGTFLDYVRLAQCDANNYPSRIAPSHMAPSFCLEKNNIQTYVCGLVLEFIILLDLQEEQFRTDRAIRYK